MRSIVLCVLFLTCTAAFAQSKKELLAEKARLEAELVSKISEITSLKGEVEELKKPKEVALADDKLKASYGIGILMAKNLKMQGGDSLNLDALKAGIQDVYLNNKLQMEEEACATAAQTYMQKASQLKADKMKEAGVAFLSQNKTKEGVKTTASGLQYKVITSGKGKTPTASNSVTVHYKGTLIDGTPFDSSVERGQPATFNVGGVIPGWTEALQLMHEGDKWTLFIPSELAYGPSGAGGIIPPYSTLIFEVELIKVN
jgi:FKBP-type peptidyl-prolyl cis-trans isomerase